MDEEPDWAADDPEIAALLKFTPVVRKNVRHDGWNAARQRGFIAWLAVKGKVPLAALAIGKRESGAWTVRNTDALGEFSAAWDAALALWHARRAAADPPPPPRAPPPGPRDRLPPEPPELTPAEIEESYRLCRDSLFPLYVTKLRQEREARLRGCIVEADFYVRQIAWMEVAFDVAQYGKEAVRWWAELKREGRLAAKIVATPLSLWLDHFRRRAWAKYGEPERPPPPELGIRKGSEIGVGGPSDHGQNRASDEERALRAEAQLLWERKAREEAVRWRERLGLPPPGEGEDGEEGGVDGSEEGK